MGRHFIQLALCAWIVGCESTAPPPHRGVPDDDVAVGTELRGIGRQRSRPSRSRGTRDIPEGSKNERGQDVKKTQNLDSSEMERQLALERALGDPKSCLEDYQPTATTKLEFTVSAIVSTSGRVTRGSAYGPGLPASAQKCLRDRVEALTLKGLRLTGPANATATYAYTFNVERIEVVTPVEGVARYMPKESPPLRPGQQEISGGSSEDIAGGRGQSIQGPEGDEISGPAGKPIEGPEGVPIN